MRKGILVLFVLLFVVSAPASYAICLTCNFVTCNCDRGNPGDLRCSADVQCCQSATTHCFAPPRPIAGDWTVASVEVTRPSAAPVRTTSQQKLASAAAKAPATRTR